MSKRKLLIATLAASIAGNLFFLLKRNRWRKAYLYELTDHVEDILQWIEVEFFQRYKREETREAIHDSLIWLMGNYKGNVSHLIKDMDTVKKSLRLEISDDPKGSKAYKELIEVLEKLEEYVKSITPDPDLIDILKGGIWGENREFYYHEPLPKYVFYDSKITPKVVLRQRYPDEWI